MKQPVGYLRKSRVTTDHTVSWEVQEAAIRDLASQQGHTEGLVLLSDWNKSGRKDGNGRPGYRRLLEMIEAGEVAALYSYSLSRLSRSLADFAKLVDICRTHSVPMRLAADRHLDFDSASGRAMINVLASFAQMEAELAQERARDTVVVRRARGDQIGPPFYGAKEGEDVSVVVAAFREAGSVLGAARLLNRQGVPTRRGGMWSTTSVHQILRRVDAVPQRSGQGVKAAAPFIFYRLLHCHCGRSLTGVRYRNGPNAGYVSYRCLQGRTDPDHGNPQSVPESRVLPWVQAEVARLRMPHDWVQLAERDERRRLELEARRRRILDNYEDGLIDRAERDAKLGGLADELERLDAAVRVVVVPELDWTRPPAQVNAVLRALFACIELDEHMRPVHAEWLVPEWRAP